jgi:putative ABC transport system substrate-binding protein
MILSVTNRDAQQLGKLRMNRRDLVMLIGAAAACPVAARAQQAALPLIGFVSGRGREDSVRFGDAFRQGLGEAGIVEGRSATVDYHWLDGQYDQLPALMSDFVRRRAAVIATPGSNPATLAAKAATATIPIAFGVGDDPVKLGLVASLARPGGNATGINFFAVEVASKQLGLLHELVPKAARVAVLINPANSTNTESTLRDVLEAASALGLQVQALKATNVGEIDDAFGELVRERAEALLIGPDAFLTSRRVQIAVLAARHRIPTAGVSREFVEGGELMSYGTDTVDMYRQVGSYAGRILKGAKPADLPVQQSTKFEFVINVSTAKALGLDVPPALLLRADAVIE